jgi:hypothetical protein
MAKSGQENRSSEPSARQPNARPSGGGKKVVKQLSTAELPWGPLVRWLVSLLVVLHLAAVVSAPWNLATADALPPGYGFQQPPPPESIVWQKPVVPRRLHKFFHDYLNLLYLNHGYEFFAPDPAGTHVIDYQVTPPDGQLRKGRFPSHDEQWPRLLYHRHMMLAEQTQMPVMGPRAGQHYADYLATRYGGTSQLQLKIHTLLPPQRVANQTPLDAPSTFQVMGTATGRPRPTASPSTPGESPVAIPEGQ